jgi:hypothetical protein
MRASHYVESAMWPGNLQSNEQEPQRMLGHSLLLGRFSFARVRAVEVSDVSSASAATLFLQVYMLHCGPKGICSARQPWCSAPCARGVDMHAHPLGPLVRRKLPHLPSLTHLTLAAAKPNLRSF